MTEVILFADVEALVVTWLKSKIAGVSVSTKIPDPRPTKLIKVTRLGGSKKRLNADSPMVVFECWGSTSVEASTLCQQARAYVNAMEGETINGTWIFKVREAGGPAFFPDPNTTLPRYQFSVTIDTKGKTL